MEGSKQPGAVPLCPGVDEDLSGEVSNGEIHGNHLAKMGHIGHMDAPGDEVWPCLSRCRLLQAPQIRLQQGKNLNLRRTMNRKE